jgi:acetyl-CoA carboxylase carboxyltransferase component
MTWQPELDELELKRTIARRMGGTDGVARQRAQGRLTVRERVTLLLDPGTFEETQSSLGPSEYDEDGNLVAYRPGNVIAGYGAIDGRTVCVRADDFTIRGGSSDAAGTAKRTIEQTAGDLRVPLVLLLDGAGGSVGEVEGRKRGDPVAETRPPLASLEPAVEPLALPPTGVPGSVDVPQTFDPAGIVPMARNDLATLMSRGNLLAQVPVAAAVLGSAAGWIAIAAAETHFSVMTKETSELFVAGPPLIRQAMGIEITKQELGNYRIQAQHTGIVNNVAESEDDALGQIRTFLSYLPQNVWQLPPRIEPADDPNRRDEPLDSIIPKNRRRTYEVRKVIDAVVDNGSAFEVSPLFGRAIVTMLARVDGFPVAVIANDCRQDGGAQTASACQKFERFVDFANTFHLPVVYLCDVPGFHIGPEAEKQGTIRWALRANIAVREATVPYITILMRRFYGVAMGGAKRGQGLNKVYGWPSAETGSLPAAGGVMAAYRRQIEASLDPDGMRIEIEDRLNRLASVLRRPQTVEEIIAPRNTRPVVVEFIRRAQAVNATQLGPKLHVGMRP